LFESRAVDHLDADESEAGQALEAVARAKRRRGYQYLYRRRKNPARCGAGLSSLLAFGDLRKHDQYRTQSLLCQMRRSINESLYVRSEQKIGQKNA
jgi:hypothetical protein